MARGSSNLGLVREPKAELAFAEAREVQGLALGLVREGPHQRLGDLRLRCLFSSASGPARARHCRKFGRIQVLGAEAGYLSRGLDDDGAAGPRDADGVLLVIFQSEWLRLKQPDRVAMVDHFLQHVDRHFHSGRWFLLDHPVADFPEVVKRRGLYLAGLREMQEAMPTQLGLLEPGGADDADGGDRVNGEADVDGE